MKIVENERVIFCDVDDTLVMHADDIEGLPNEEIAFITDAVTRRTVKLRKNMPMIRLLQEENVRGAYTIVWSRGGFEWASAVIEACDLKPYVHQVMSKPLVYLDDKPVQEWLKDRVWLGPDTKYKFNIS